MEFVHIGVPTTEIKENEIYLAPLKVFVTVADNHEYKFEYLTSNPETKRVLEKNIEDGLRNANNSLNINFNNLL